MPVYSRYLPLQFPRLFGIGLLACGTSYADSQKDRYLHRNFVADAVTIASPCVVNILSRVDGFLGGQSSGSGFIISQVQFDDADVDEFVMVSRLKIRMVSLLLMRMLWSHLQAENL